MRIGDGLFALMPMMAGFARLMLMLPRRRRRRIWRHLLRVSTTTVVARFTASRQGADCFSLIIHIPFHA